MDWRFKDAGITARKFDLRILVFNNREQLALFLVYMTYDQPFSLTF